MIELLEQLIPIPSYSRGEIQAADLVENYLEKLGLSYNRKGNNLWCCSEEPSDKPTILLDAHIDTIKPGGGWSIDPFTPTYKSVRDSDGITRTRLYGVGANDDGGSLIALLMTYCKLIQSPQPYRLIFSASAEEEVSGTGGLEAVFPELGRIDLGVIGEPTGMRMAVAERGLMVLDCTAKGVSGHAAREEGVNAITNAIKDIEWFNSYRFERVSDYLGAVKMSVTMINAGTQHNVIPDSCTFVADVRSNGLYSNHEILSIIKSSVECSVKERSTRMESSSISMENPIVIRAKELGIETFGSPTTSNQAISHFDTIKMGPGDSSRSHSADEYIRPDEIEQGSEIFYKLLNGLKLEKR